MDKISLAEKVKRAKESNFSLPKEVSMQKTLLPNGKFAYVFRYTTMGELGRMLILPHPSGQSQFLFEASGEPDDPMTKKRAEILKPISDDILSKMEAVCGKGTGEPTPFATPRSQHKIKAEIMRCEKCNASVAQMIIAEDAETADRLEDYARITFPKLKELNVPAWIVGAEREVRVNGAFAGEALVMPVWPKKEKASHVLSIDLNAKFDVLVKNHCK